MIRAIGILCIVAGLLAGAYNAYCEFHGIAVVTTPIDVGSTVQLPEPVTPADGANVYRGAHLYNWSLAAMVAGLGVAILCIQRHHNRMDILSPDRDEEHRSQRDH